MLSLMTAGDLEVRTTLAAARAIPAPFVAEAGRSSAVQGPKHADDGSSVKLRVGFLRNGSYEVATMPLETYVAQVVAGEAAPRSDPAALEALAITVRTFALANRGRHRVDGFDLCDQTHCQVARNATGASERAAEATSGAVLLHNGAPASVYYSASCGGRTEVPSAVWPGAEDPSYLPSRVDEACGGDPAWTAELASSDLERALKAAGFRGALRAMRIRSRSDSGRVAHLTLDGLAPPDISGQDLRVAVGRTLGWQYLKSTAFELRQAGAVYRFTGHGSGHGVGMCVIGATKLAAHGERASAILARYFPGLEIGPAGPRLTSGPPGGPTIGPPRVAAASPDRVNRANAGVRANLEVLVSLPDEDEGERAAITSLALGARDELAQTLGLIAPRVTLRFHPTTDDYERTTGQPWFTSGALVGAEAHFVPLVSLRDSGMLERVVRRELVRILTGPSLTQRAEWVREGAALFFADAMSPGLIDVPSSGRRAACPDDGELLRPVSAGALSNAYARARTCFARQIASGRSWRDVR